MMMMMMPRAFAYKHTQTDRQTETDIDFNWFNWLSFSRSFCISGLRFSPIDERCLFNGSFIPHIVPSLIKTCCSIRMWSFSHNALTITDQDEQALEQSTYEKDPVIDPYDEEITQCESPAQNVIEGEEKKRDYVCWICGNVGFYPRPWLRGKMALRGWPVVSLLSLASGFKFV